MVADPVLLESELGYIPKAQDYLTRIREITRGGHDFGLVGLVVPVVAQKVERGDQLDLAETTAETVFSSPSATSSETGRAKTGLAMIGVLRGGRAGAARFYDSISARKGTTLFWVISADRLLGLLSETMADLEQSAAHFEDALTFCRKAGV